MSAPAAGIPATPSRCRAGVEPGDARPARHPLLNSAGISLWRRRHLPMQVLTDGAAETVLPAAVVAVGAVGGEFAGWLPPDAGAAQIDAALRAVAAGLTVRATPLQTRNFDALPEEPPIL